MMIDFDEKKVKITHTPFYINDIKISDKTASIDFFKENELIITQKYAYIEPTMFSDMVEKLTDIDLTKCYFDKINENKARFTSFSITDSFFDVENLTLKLLISSKISFKGSVFNCKYVDFSHSKLKTFSDFSDTTFVGEVLNFNQTIFRDGLSFKNSKFKCDIKQFEKIEVSEGEINFTNVDFGKGSISFQDAKLSDDRKNFTLARFGTGFKDFTRTKFGNGNVFFERADFGDGNVSFRSAEFGDGTVDFRRAEFGHGEKNFMHTDFGHGNIKFINTVFKSGKITFRLANFGKGKIDFHFSNFGDTDFIFERTRFDVGVLDFRGVEFKKAKISLNHLDFNDGDFIFEGFEVSDGNISIKNSVFGRGFINFENAQCPNSNFLIENVDFGYGIVSFQNSIFKKMTLKGSQINRYFDLRIRKVEIIDLSNTVINDVLDLSPSESPLNVKTIYLQGVRLLGKIYIDWTRSNVEKLIKNQNVSAYEKCEQFRILKENYRDMGLYDEEDLAYVEFKRMQAVSRLENIENLSFFGKIKAYISYYFELIVFDKMGHYATNPVLVLKSMGVAYVFFSLLFLFFEIIFPNNAQIMSSLFEPGNPQIMGNVAKAFYHSAITFFTIGYGDYYPVGISRVLSGIEGFIGMFFMSYFTVAFVRKILR